MSGTANKSEYLNNVLRHIESNLPDDLDTERLARVGYVSPPKLYRDFYNLTGHSVKEYIRKRRLSNALALIKTSDMELTDIAYQCGYASYLTLWRAMKQMLGLAPSEYKTGNTYYFFPPFSGEPVQSVTVSNDVIPPTLRVLYYSSQLSNIEKMAVDTFLRAVPAYAGRIFGRNGKQRGSKFCYELYVTDAGFSHESFLPYCFELMDEIPAFAATFATSAVRNDEARINAAWDYLYAQWLQESMFEYTGEPHYEEYILRSGKPAKLKLYLPIRKRNEETKISLIGNPRLRFISAQASGFTAERIASQTIVDYMAKRYPHIVQASKDLYVRKTANAFVCGVGVDWSFRFVEDENITSVTTKCSHYLVLESNVIGDYDRYAAALFSFAQANGMNADRKDIFAVYNTRRGIDNLSIKLYCPVKLVIK